MGEEGKLEHSIGGGGGTAEGLEHSTKGGQERLSLSSAGEGREG